MVRESVRRSRRERGAIAVEAALITPLLMAVLLGIVEMSLLMRDYVAVGSAVRVGARVASASASAGPGICVTGPTAPPCTSQSSPALAQAAADAIQRNGSAMPKDAINYLLVYKANAAGYPGTSTSMPSTCAGISDCVRFVWRDDLDAFRWDSGAWASASINACVNEADAVGIYLNASHVFVSGVFGNKTAVADRSVMKFEPLTDDTCKPGRPAAHQ